MGVVIFGALAVYAIVLVVITWFAYRWAAKRGLPRGKRWLAAAGGFLTVYLPVFWDHVPTLIAHKYYCEKEAGFWVYKTLAQWEKENPGVKDTLVRSKEGSSSYEGNSKNFVSTNSWNYRVSSVLEKRGPLPLNRWRWENQVVDVKTGESLARRVTFSTGLDGRIGGEPELRFWLHRDGCGGDEADARSLVEFAERFRGVEK